MTGTAKIKYQDTAPLSTLAARRLHQRRFPWENMLGKTRFAPRPDTQTPLREQHIEIIHLWPPIFSLYIMHHDPSIVGRRPRCSEQLSLPYIERDPSEVEEL